MKLTTARRPSLHSALLCTTALILVPGSLAGATDLTVQNGTTETMTITLPDAGDTLIIEQGGAIVSTGVDTDGVDAFNDNQTVNNAGRIEATRYGIYSTGADAIITNSGTISGSIIPFAVVGIQFQGANAIITNSGTINAYTGIFTTPTAVGARITNTGTINSNLGIISRSPNADILNSGTIYGNSGIASEYNNAKITNSGIIIINSGATGISDYGIYSFGDDAEITNSGMIFAAHGTRAIELVGERNTLKLRAGSVIEGGVGLSNSTATLDIGVGLNLYLDYTLVDRTSLSPADFQTLTSRIPMVHDETNLVIYTVDPTGFALAQSFVQTTAETVHEAVRTGAGRGNRFGGGFGGQSSFSYGTDAPGFEATGPRGWVSGFGGYQSQGGSGAVTGGTQAYGGLVSGGGMASDERLLGAFAGGSYTQQETEFNTQEIDAATAFGGVYAGTRAGAIWVRGGLLGGYTDFSSDRTVANNNVAGGLETASADYGATFISPSVTIGRGIGERTELSLGGHYAALFVDGYSESGSAADLTVASRTVQVASVRAKASYLAHQKQTQSGQMSVETWAGVDGVFNLGGDDVDASVAAGAFDTFSASFFDASVMGFAGIGVNHKSTSGKWLLNANAEGRYGSNDYWDIKGTASAQMKF